MTLSGEYWIKEDGSYVFCDGDVDVSAPNHNAIVVKHALGMIISGISEFGSQAAKQLICSLGSIIEQSEGVLDCVSMRTMLNDYSDQMHSEGIITDEQTNDIYGWLAKEGAFAEILTDIAFDGYAFEGSRKPGYEDIRDSRSFAIKKWAWIRVAGNEITIPFIAGCVCRRLYGTLGEIVFEETDGARTLDKMLWNVESVRPSAFKTGITSLQLSDAKTLRELLQPTSVCTG